MFKAKNTLEICAILGSLVAIISLLVLTGYIRIEGIWFILPFTHIRITTVITMFLSFGIVLFLQGKLWWRSLYRAVLSVIFFLALYETIWYQIAAYYFNYDPRLFEFSGLFGWILLSISEVYPTKPPRLSLALYITFIVSMVLWVATGFSVDYPGGPVLSITSEVFNVISKASLAIAFAINMGVSHKNP